MRDDKDNLIVNLTFEFALQIIEFSEELETAKKYVIANRSLSPVLLSAQMFGKRKMLRAKTILSIS